MSAARSQAVKFWDGTARKYAANPVSNEAAYQQTLTSVKSHLTATTRVLEVGCGTGSTVLKLAPHAGFMLGTDFSPNMIEICNEKRKEAGDDIASRTKFAVGDICLEDGHKDSAEKGSFDMVLAFNLLYLLQDPTSAIRNVNGMLKPGGVFISKNLVRDNMGLKYKLLTCAIPVMAMLGFAPSGIQFQTAKQLEASIEISGFEITESVFPKGDEERKYIVARKTGEA